MKVNEILNLTESKEDKYKKLILNMTDGSKIDFSKESKNIAEILFTNNKDLILWYISTGPKLTEKYGDFEGYVVQYGEDWYFTNLSDNDKATYINFKRIPIDNEIWNKIEKYGDNFEMIPDEQHVLEYIKLFKEE